MRLNALGDRAWLIEFGEPVTVGQVAGLAAELGRDRPPGVLDVVPAFDTLAVHFCGENGPEIADWIRSVTVTEVVPTGRFHEISVIYGGEYGPDLDEVARAAGMSPDEVVALHSGADYTVAAIGFSPGFPYLAGLPAGLDVPRKSTPGLALAAGSVAVAAGQAGIYSFASPGGWHVLGRTSVHLFDPRWQRPALMRAGDRVRFVAVESLEEVKVNEPPDEDVEGERWIEVVEPGGLTTVQDVGRPGYEDSGVSPGGAVDLRALRLANLLVGNDENAAVFECCVRGPVLRFHGATTVALVGGGGRSWTVADGETVDFSKLPDGVRACLAVAGGIRVEKVLGSASTDVRAGFGGHRGRALVAGDSLAVGEPGRAPRCGDWHVGRPTSGVIPLRFLPGGQQNWFSVEARRRFRESVYEVTALAGRMGARLSGPVLESAGHHRMRSQPVACGSVQVPPDGQPIVLLAERQTMGVAGHAAAIPRSDAGRGCGGTDCGESSIRKVAGGTRPVIVKTHATD